MTTPASPTSAQPGPYGTRNRLGRSGAIRYRSARTPPRTRSPRSPAQVQRPAVVRVHIAAEAGELRQRRRRVDHHQPVVGGERRHRPARPLVQLSPGQGYAGPVRVAPERPGRPHPVPAGPHRLGHPRALAIGAHDQVRPLGDRSAPPRKAADPGDPIARADHPFHHEVLPDLGARGPRGLHQQRVQHRAPRAVEGVHPVVRREMSIQDGMAGVEADPAGGRRAGHPYPFQQSPPVQPGHTGHLDLVGGQGVAGKPGSVDREHPQPPAGEQHGGRRARDPGSHHDHVVPHRVRPHDHTAEYGHTIRLRMVRAQPRPTPAR